ncbi:MAG: uroporphyrinogen decarboxylase [Alphaproteobacteria bacterium]|nr:uroporphyrinogen decarboxylase [Alphaproteobacteria bacterium]
MQTRGPHHVTSRRPAPSPLLRALAGEILRTPPVWLMRQAGRYLPEYRKIRAEAGGFLALCYTPELAEEVTLQPVRRFGVDAAILFSDILVIPQALGQEVRFEEGEGPRLAPVRDEAGVSALRSAAAAATNDGFEETLGPVYETVRRVSKALPDECSLIGFAGAPWTVATYMVEGGTSRDFHTVKRWALTDPDGFEKLIGVLVDATAAYLNRQIDAGAAVVQLFDSHTGVLPEGAFVRWSIRPTKRIVEQVRSRHPDVPIIGFPRGAGINYERYVRETGVTAVGLDSAVPLSWARTALQPILPVQGNLDPVLLLHGGAPMETAVREILSVLGGGPMIFNLGHGVIKETPPEHVAALIECVRRGPV